ncbi:unnamed protein product, partial [Didymodactylos carnosus]
LLLSFQTNYWLKNKWYITFDYTIPTLLSNNCFIVVYSIPYTHSYFPTHLYGIQSTLNKIIIENNMINELYIEIKSCSIMSFYRHYKYVKKLSLYIMPFINKCDLTIYHDLSRIIIIKKLIHLEIDGILRIELIKELLSHGNNIKILKLTTNYNYNSLNLSNILSNIVL